MIKTAEELRARLEGKTERTAIEAILNGATVAPLKAYMKEEGFDCTGYHTWKKVDFVETIAVALMEDIASEHAAENKPHFVFEIGKKYAGKLNGVPTVFTVEDYEEDVIALTAANGEFHSCIVGGFIEGAFGKSDTVTERNSKWTVSVTARDIVKEQPAEESQEKTIPASAQAEDANFSKEIIKLLLESLAERKAETASQPEALYEDEAFSDFLGDNSQPEQDIPEAHSPEETPAPVKANQSEENFLKRETISQKKKEITAMLNKYAEINGTVRAIRDGVKTFRKCIKMGIRQGLPTNTFEKAIKEVREKYREWRIEGFKLRLKLLRVMSASEIRRACEMYIARCERIRRRHMRK